ncbi:uncharacterized protein BO80DRAFT_178061 [Aspergillus ibericus CBS 121593]|uniref:Uncharacterized protein n=1 Tax=Aspergillus ibericus CBS 121593 TaxID=1448316 RepID=A0A395HBX9_9EURO|nr:hypothetical protein BO80DRAFT_178061 [Aspergillus ibericus CBS 121593]RAL05136.1 hypothetical protein BO80DRAFT_178061 [Aspergillus ibericus CBS 121593]
MQEERNEAEQRSLRGWEKNNGRLSAPQRGNAAPHHVRTGCGVPYRLRPHCPATICWTGCNDRDGGQDALVGCIALSLLGGLGGWSHCMLWQPNETASNLDYWARLFISSIDTCHLHLPAWDRCRNRFNFHAAACQTGEKNAFLT